MRVYNFSPGPSMLPQAVLELAAKELVEFGSSGMSVMEMSHRSKPYMELHEQAQVMLRKLMTIPDNYKILFLQGGASMQFAQVPLNLLTGSGHADYIESGNFAKLAIKEAKRFGQINVVASSAADNYSRIPDWDASTFDPSADYFHITTNNTIYGTRFSVLPETGDVPLVADMSSNILSEVYDVSKFGLIYAGAQKNIGPAGVTVVIIREDLLGRACAEAPTMLNYQTMAENDSMYNTPPTYGIYIALRVFEWLNQLGGVPAIEKINIGKAQLLYDYLDSTDFYRATARACDRSRMNVTFVCADSALDDVFVKEAAKEGLVNLKGHRSVGGMRASIYNAMPVAGVEKLVAFMKNFANRA